MLTLGEARAQLQIPDGDTSQDAELQAYIDGITDAVEEYKHEVIEQRSVVDDIDVCGYGLRFRLWSAPVVALDSVVSWDGTTTWDVDDMRVSESGSVRVMRGAPVRGPVVVTYLAGYATVPERYKRGALIILQHTWESRRGVGNYPGGVVGAEEIHARTGPTYSIPRKALEWLGPPRPVVA